MTKDAAELWAAYLTTEVREAVQKRCPYAPETIGPEVPLGMHHCPQCGCMVVAGMRHGVCLDSECEFYDAAADVQMNADLAAQATRETGRQNDAW